MQNEYETNAQDSASNFIEIVGPKMVELGWISGELTHIESVVENRPMVTKLDILAGMDVWIVKESLGIIGLASRCQFADSKYGEGFDVDNPWNTFTIRESSIYGGETELAKRKRALESNGKYLYPYFMCNAYITKSIGGELISLGLAKTQDIVNMVGMMGYPREYAGKIFVCIDWHQMYKKIGKRCDVDKMRVWCRYEDFERKWDGEIQEELELDKWIKGRIGT